MIALAILTGLICFERESDPAPVLLHVHLAEKWGLRALRERFSRTSLAAVRGGSVGFGDMVCGSCDG
jgi:hypothetical protein